MEIFSYKEMQSLIKSHSKDELVMLSEQYIHHDRNRQIFLERMLEHTRIEPLSVKYDITARRCSDIIKECSSIIFPHIIP